MSRKRSMASLSPPACARFISTTTGIGLSSSVGMPRRRRSSPLVRKASERVATRRVLACRWVPNSLSEEADGDAGRSRAADVLALLRVLVLFLTELPPGRSVVVCRGDRRPDIYHIWPSCSDGSFRNVSTSLPPFQHEVVDATHGYRGSRFGASRASL